MCKPGFAIVASFTTDGGAREADPAAAWHAKGAGPRAAHWSRQEL
jgi:hypothetical protein